MLGRGRPIPVVRAPYGIERKRRAGRVDRLLQWLAEIFCAAVANVGCTSVAQQSDLRVTPHDMHHGNPFAQAQMLQHLADVGRRSSVHQCAVPFAPNPSPGRPRRSVIYVPAANSKAMAKVRALASDAVILATGPTVDHASRR